MLIGNVPSAPSNNTPFETEPVYYIDHPPLNIRTPIHTRSKMIAVYLYKMFDCKICVIS